MDHTLTDSILLAERSLLSGLKEGQLTAVADLLEESFLITTAGWITDPVDKRT